MAEAFWQEPFFWACFSLLALVAGDAIVANALPRSRALGLAVVASFTLGRAVLVLPFCAQPRFALGGAESPLGLALLALGLAFIAPVLRVQWTTGPARDEPLRSDGVFGVVRHPGYLGNVLLGLGWSVLFGSWIGVLLTPVWGLAFWLHALIEEASLARAYGDPYRAYMRRVPARLLPWPRRRRDPAGG